MVKAVDYCLEHIGVTQKALADELGVDEPWMTHAKRLHYGASAWQKLCLGINQKVSAPVGSMTELCERFRVKDKKPIEAFIAKMTETGLALIATRGASEHLSNMVKSALASTRAQVVKSLDDMGNATFSDYRLFRQ